MLIYVMKMCLPYERNILKTSTIRVIIIVMRRGLIILAWILKPLGI